MKETGALGAQDHTVTRLAKVNTTTAQRRDPITYRVGQVVEFHRRAPGFKSGERVEVVSVENLNVTVTIGGNPRVLPISHAQTFDLYTREQLPVAAGDTLRVTKNFQAGGKKFRNNELVSVKEIKGGNISTIDGRSIQVGDSNLIHLEQGIAVTSHASQGKTVDQVIVSAPVEAFSQVNQAQFYVSMSRARHAMHLITDSVAALRQAVTKTSQRPSAMSILNALGRGDHAPSSPSALSAAIRWQVQGKARETVGRGR
jgi:ATP-dependent exoDNAse (exonuclease V) alpha subunit